MNTLNLSYPVWKSTQAYLTTQSKGSVYYVTTSNTYTIIMVNPARSMVFSHSLARKDQSQAADLVDFETNIKPTATAVNSADDAVALAIAAAAA